MVDVKQSIKTAEAKILQYKQQRPIPLPPTEPDARLAEEGFPKKVSKAFQKTADKLNCVVWSRVPGRACTTLIDEGYNLKPFYVHGKSCNWGPMSGFVCQLPALNKSGTSKMAYNLKEHMSSLAWLLAVGATEQEQDKVADSLYLPLVISDARKQELLGNGTLPNRSVIAPDLICGIAQDAKQTVAIEYVMKRQAANPNLWNLYHRNIYIKRTPGAGYSSYLQVNGTKFSVNQTGANDQSDVVPTSYNQSIQASIDPETIAPADVTHINQALQGLGIVPANDRPITRFYPINGVQSPYLAYRDNANRYKNAVSGDYDLFAVWPFTPNASFEMTTRISELESQPNDDPLGPEDRQNLFIPVETKKNALEIAKSRNVFVEFIGTYQELDEKEDPEVGNINDLVSITAQTLNSLVQAIYQGQPDGGQFPNRAFHSDEGGRPGVDEIEYPIAFFVPRSQWSRLKQHDVKQQNVLKNTAFVVENHAEFLSLVQLLRRRFYVFLHDGWFMHWMSLTAGKNKLTELMGNVAFPDRVRRYFGALVDEIDDLNDADLRAIASLLQELLLSRTLPASASLTRAFQDVVEHFTSFPTYPQTLDSAERKALISPLEIK
ncbi:MAG: anthrax toxin-like adenylyl cyclase domain-containing protein [Cyanobacteria bacterium J06635_15]